MDGGGDDDMTKKFFSDLEVLCRDIQSGIKDLRTQSSEKSKTVTINNEVQQLQQRVHTGFPKIFQSSSMFVQACKCLVDNHANVMDYVQRKVGFEKIEKEVVEQSPPTPCTPAQRDGVESSFRDAAQSPTPLTISFGSATKQHVTASDKENQVPSIEDFVQSLTMKTPPHRYEKLPKSTASLSPPSLPPAPPAMPPPPPVPELPASIVSTPKGAVPPTQSSPSSDLMKTPDLSDFGLGAYHERSQQHSLSVSSLNMSTPSNHNAGKKISFTMSPMTPSLQPPPSRRRRSPNQSSVDGDGGSGGGGGGVNDGNLFDSYTPSTLPLSPIVGRIAPLSTQEYDTLPSFVRAQLSYDKANAAISTLKAQNVHKRDDLESMIGKAGILMLMKTKRLTSEVLSTGETVFYPSCS